MGNVASLVIFNVLSTSLSGMICAFFREAEIVAAGRLLFTAAAGRPQSTAFGL